MRLIEYVLILSVVGAALAFGGCVRDRSTPYLDDRVATLEKQLDEADREYARLIAERARLEGDVEEAGLLAGRAAELLREKARLEEELAIARIELERAGAVTVAGETTGTVRRTDLTGGEGGVAGGPTGTYSGGSAGGVLIPDELPFTPSRTEVHIVSKGESLSKIAGYDSYYGNQSLWPYIYVTNRRQIQDPNWIFEGQQLTVPLQ